MHYKVYVGSISNIMSRNIFVQGNFETSSIIDSMKVISYIKVIDIFTVIRGYIYDLVNNKMRYMSRFQLHSHYLVHIKNNTYFIGINPTIKRILLKYIYRGINVLPVPKAGGAWECITIR